MQGSRVPPSISLCVKLTAFRQYFHADPSDIVGLLCIARALEGGESDITSVHNVYNTLRAERPDVLKTLTEPNWYFDRKGEVSRGEEPYIRDSVFYLEPKENGRVYCKYVWPGSLPTVPRGRRRKCSLLLALMVASWRWLVKVFNNFDGFQRLPSNLAIMSSTANQNFRWDPYYVRSLERFSSKGIIPPLSPAQSEAADVLEATCKRLSLHMILEVGDIQFLSNAQVLHARTEYTDHAPPAPRRHLMRLWLATPESEGGWCLPFHDRDEKKRGGIQVDDTPPVAHLDAD